MRVTREIHGKKYTPKFTGSGSCKNCSFIYLDENCKTINGFATGCSPMDIWIEYIEPDSDNKRSDAVIQELEDALDNVIAKKYEVIDVTNLLRKRCYESEEKIQKLKLKIETGERIRKIQAKSIRSDMKTIEKLKDSITRSHRGNNRYENKLKEEVEQLKKELEETHVWLSLARFDLKRY